MMLIVGWGWCRRQMPEAFPQRGNLTLQSCGRQKLNGKPGKGISTSPHTARQILDRLAVAQTTR
jgi:hypothetical protein